MRDTAAIARGEVAAHPVVVELVVVGTRAEGDATCGRRRARIQGVADGRVVRDRVVVDLHAPVEPIPGLLAVDQAACRLVGNGRVVGVADDERIRELALADGDAAGERAVVAPDARVGDFQIMVPGMREDRSAALRAVDHAQAVDARRIAEEVAGAVVEPVRASRARRAVRGAGREIGVPGWEDAFVSRAPEIGAAGRQPNAAAENRDAGSFIGAHDGGLLQLLRQVAVAGDVPADDRFDRKPVDP